MAFCLFNFLINTPQKRIYINIYNSQLSFSIISKPVSAATAKSGGSEAEKQYPCPDNLWWSITKDGPAQKPPTEPRDVSRETAIKSIWSNYGYNGRQIKKLVISSLLKIVEYSLFSL